MRAPSLVSADSNTNLQVCTLFVRARAANPKSSMRLMKKKLLALRQQQLLLKKAPDDARRLQGIVALGIADRV